MSKSPPADNPLRLILRAFLLAALLVPPRAHAQIEDAAEQDDLFSDALATGDFNGDGVADLAVGVPFEDVGTVLNAGAVNVIYGSVGVGLASAGDQLWHQSVAGVLDVAEASDAFGHALAVGDFDGDGFDDLAIGVRGETVGTLTGAGAVTVLYGAAGVGLTEAGDQLWHQDTPDVLETAEAGDRFGSALAAGDFDGDGFDDLAVGVPEEDLVATLDGLANVLYGAAGVGLTATGDQLWHQNIPNVEDTAETSDQLGTALTTGDFDGDGFDDLAIGVPFEDVGAVSNAGAVNVVYGSSGVGLTATGDQLWHQDTPGVLDAAEGDTFGRSLASGDFDGDGFADLAVGVAFEDVGAVSNAGAVNVLYGSAGTGLTATGDQFWHQNVAGVLGASGSGDFFGGALAAGDFDGDGFADLASGVVGEDVGAQNGAGAAHVLYGSAGVGLTATGDQLWHQDVLDVEDAAEPSDGFGETLAAGDFDGDGFSDLAFGVPPEDLAFGNVGAVNVVYGLAGTGLATAGNQFWHQDSSAPGPLTAPGVMEVAAGVTAMPTLHAPAPNPVAGRGILRYDVAAPGRVRLAVYDLLGREVAVLADGAREAGRHEVAFDGRLLPAGVYLVRMMSDAGFVQTQRVTLVR